VAILSVIMVLLGNPNGSQLPQYGPQTYICNIYGSGIFQLWEMWMSWDYQGSYGTQHLRFPPLATEVASIGWSYFPVWAWNSKQSTAKYRSSTGMGHSFKPTISMDNGLFYRFSIGFVLSVMGGRMFAGTPFEELQFCSHKFQSNRTQKQNTSKLSTLIFCSCCFCWCWSVW